MNPVYHLDLQVAAGIFPAVHPGAERLLDQPDVEHLGLPDENLANHPGDSDSRLDPVLGQGGTAAVVPAFPVDQDAVHSVLAVVFLPVLLPVADQPAVQLVAGEVEFLGVDRLAVALQVLVLCLSGRPKPLVQLVAQQAVVPSARELQVLH